MQYSEKRLPNMENAGFNLKYDYVCFAVDLTCSQFSFLNCIIVMYSN